MTSIVANRTALLFNLAMILVSAPGKMAGMAAVRTVIDTNEQFLEVCCMGNFEQVRENFTLDVDAINFLCRDERGNTGLHLAVLAGNGTLCKFLLENHLLLCTLTNDDQETALSLAALQASEGNSSMLDIFFEARIIGNFQENMADFHAACWNGDLPKIKQLLQLEGVQNYFNINFVDNLGRSALHVAVLCLDPELCELLIMHNINPDILDNSNCTAYQKATQLSDAESVIDVFFNMDVPGCEYEDPSMLLDDDGGGAGSWHEQAVRSAEDVVHRVYQTDFPYELRTVSS